MFGFVHGSPRKVQESAKGSAKTKAADVSSTCGGRGQNVELDEHQLGRRRAQTNGVESKIDFHDQRLLS